MTGEVIRWNNISGPEKLDAVKYIELLEAEIEELNRQIERRSGNGPNELLDYLKSLEPQNLKVRILLSDYMLNHEHFRVVLSFPFLVVRII